MEEGLSKKTNLDSFRNKLNTVRKIESNRILYWFGEDIIKIFNITTTDELKRILSSTDYLYTYVNKNDSKKTFLVNEYGVYK